MDSWQKVFEILKQGGVVIIPSDSSYGLAALAESSQDVEKLYQIKRREDNKPSLVIVGSMEQAHQLVKFTPQALELSKKYWPGGLTLVLEAKNNTFSPLIYGENQTLAVRFPNKPELQDLVSQTGPFILPSANFNGQPTPFSSSKVDPELIKLVDYFLDDSTDGNPVSTLVDARGEKPIILREGAVKIDELE